MSVLQRETVARKKCTWSQWQAAEFHTVKRAASASASLSNRLKELWSIRQATKYVWLGSEESQAWRGRQRTRYISYFFYLPWLLPVSQRYLFLAPVCLRLQQSGNWGWRCPGRPSLHNSTSGSHPPSQGAFSQYYQEVVPVMFFVVKVSVCCKCSTVK